MQCWEFLAWTAEGCLQGTSLDIVCQRKNNGCIHFILEPVFTTTSQRPPERCASQASTLSNNHDICRICHCEGDSEVPLIAPCYCSGSLRYVHQACLQQWIKSSDIRSCELCKFQFIMQSKIKPFSEWESLEMSGVERRKLLCSVTFHAVALTCVVWSLYVLIDRTAEEIQKGVLEWPFWTKLIVVAIGFTGGLVFMYIQCKAYLHLCRRWRAFNRVIFVQNAPEKVALPPVNTHPPLAREESLLVSETCCGVVTSDDTGRGKCRGSDMASAVTIDSGFHECRRKSSNKNKFDDEKQTICTSGNLTLTHADCGDEEVLKTDDSGSSYQPFEGCAIGDMNDLKGTDIRDSGANVSIRNFPYDETAHTLRDICLPVNDCEEMSHLLQGEDRKCESVCRVNGNHQGSSGFVFLPSSIPGSLDGRGKFRDDTSTSCAVSSSSSEESFQSPSIQLLQQSRKSVNGAGLQQQAPTLPARPWTVGPSNSSTTWVADVASERITNASSSSVRPKSSLGSQSPLLSVAKGSDDKKNTK